MLAGVLDGSKAAWKYVDFPAGKGGWLTLECDVDDVKEGPQALWFTFSGDWGSWRSPIELFEIDWFRFE